MLGGLRAVLFLLEDFVRKSRHFFCASVKNELEQKAINPDSSCGPGWVTGYIEKTTKGEMRMKRCAGDLQPCPGGHFPVPCCGKITPFLPKKAVTSWRPFDHLHGDSAPGRIKRGSGCPLPLFAIVLPYGKIQPTGQSSTTMCSVRDRSAAKQIRWLWRETFALVRLSPPWRRMCRKSRRMP